MQWYCVLVALLVYVIQCEAVLVNTTLGTVRGEVITLIDDYHDGIAINTFYNMPFAKPAVGDLRFAPPESPEPWDGIYNAIGHGDWCMQYASAEMQKLHQGRVNNEDCLNINIFAPADASQGPYAVMVWIYGGSYQSGSNLGYLGHFIAAQGTVVVMPNYRLGIFGFAYSGDDEIPGNMGLMDQIHALQFVQDNIAAFGGDPDRVTVFGQSAGGTSVGQLILSPWAAGLFHQAIPQSGCDLSNWGINGPDHEPENYLFQVAEDVGCPINDTAEMTECLRAVPAAVLNNAYFDCKEGYFCMGFAPVVDGPGGVIPDRPLNLRSRGEFNHVSEIIGLTRHDCFTSLPSLGDEILGEGPTYEEFQIILQRIVDFFQPRGIPDDRAEDWYQAMLFYITGWPELDDPGWNRHMLGEHMTDASYGYVADQQARSQSDYAPVWFYVFDYVSANSTWIEWMGCDHSCEIPYIMGYPFIRHNPDVREQTGIQDWYEWNTEDDEWAYFTIKLWTNFAKYGNPTPEPVSPPGDLPPLTWLDYRHSEDRYSYVHLSRDNMGSHENYRQHQYAFWRDYLPWLILKGDDPPVDRPYSAEEKNDRWLWNRMFGSAHVPKV